MITKLIKLQLDWSKLVVVERGVYKLRAHVHLLTIEQMQ